jgi:hypothetical protein
MQHIIHSMFNTECSLDMMTADCRVSVAACLDCRVHRLRSVEVQTAVYLVVQTAECSLHVQIAECINVRRVFTACSDGRVFNAHCRLFTACSNEVECSECRVFTACSDGRVFKGSDCRLFTACSDGSVFRCSECRVFTACSDVRVFNAQTAECSVLVQLTECLDVQSAECSLHVQMSECLMLRLQIVHCLFR